MHTRRFRALPARLAFMADDTEAGAGDAGATGESAAVDESTVDDGAEQPDPAGAEALGDPGKKALDAMKAKWKEADRQAKEHAAELAALKAQAEGREAEHKAEQESQRIHAEAMAKANERVLRSELKAAAAGKFADPTDVFNYLDLGSFEADDEGNFDGDAISAAVSDLLSTKPYLAAQGGPRFQGSADGGARKESGPKQVTETELQSMSPAQVERARREGRLTNLMSGKS